MGPKKKKKSVDRTNSGTSGAFLPEGQSRPMTGNMDSPPDPYSAFARFPGKKTLLAPVSPRAIIKQAPASPKVKSVPSPPPYQSISPIPNRPWSPKVYAVESVKFEPRCEPNKTCTDVNPDGSSGKALPAFHGLKSLLLDCEKHSGRKNSEEDYYDQNPPKKPK